MEETRQKLPGPNINSTGTGTNSERQRKKVHTNNDEKNNNSELAVRQFDVRPEINCFNKETLFKRWPRVETLSRT